MATTEAILRGLIEAMTKRAADLQQQAVDTTDDDIGKRKAEKAAGVRVARSFVKEALRGIDVVDEDAIFVIYTKTDDETLWWSNVNGWGDQASVTRFTEAESRAFNLPEGGRWCELAVDDGRPQPIDVAQFDALCRVLVDDGHMTPVATRQLRKLFDSDDEQN